jgi:pyruvate/2-oxoglutarate dehydrogenase complex dihydrolipoamide dehydrogenase (E3) component
MCTIAGYLRRQLPGQVRDHDWRPVGRTQHVIGREIQVIRSQLLRNHVDLLVRTARLEDPHTVTVRSEARGDHTTRY